jgi:hypothetical protein
MRQRRSLPEDVPNVVVDKLSSRHIQSEPRSLDRTYSSFPFRDDHELNSSGHYHEQSQLPSTLNDKGVTRSREGEYLVEPVTAATHTLSRGISSPKLPESPPKDGSELGMPKDPIRPPKNGSYPKGFTSFMKDIDKLCQIQQEIAVLQVDIRQKKRRIANKREKMLKWDNKIMTLNHRASTGDIVDPNEFKKAHRQAQNVRNRLGPLEDEVEREEEDLNRLEMSLLDIGDQIQEKYSRLGFHRLEDDENDLAYSSSETGSHISFESNPKVADMVGLPIYSVSDASSVGARNPHWFGDNVDDEEQRVTNIISEQEISNAEDSRLAVHIENRGGFDRHLPSFRTLADSNIRASDIESVGDWSLGTLEELPKSSSRRLIATLEKSTVVKAESIDEYNLKPHTSGLFRTSGTETFSLWSGPTLNEEACPNTSSVKKSLKQPMDSRKSWEVDLRTNLRAQVNRWLLHNLMSSTIEWRLFEAELRRSLPTNISLPQQLWEDDFKDLWSQDDLGDKAALVPSVTQSAEAYRGSLSSAPQWSKETRNIGSLNEVSRQEISFQEISQV